MHCARCGAALGESTWRCGGCRKTTPALASAVAHSLLMLGSVGAYSVYRSTYAAVLYDMHGQLGMMLPVPMRLHLLLSDWLMAYGVLPLTLLLGLLALAGNPRMPGFVRSGSALAWTASLLALWVLAGLLLGYVGMMAPVVKIE